MTVLAVMQPTFLPWLGYFALISQADRFIYLDDVQLSRQSWQTRNRLKGPNGAVMLSLAVARKPSRPTIAQARLADTGFQTKLIATATQSLTKAPYGELALGILSDAFAQADGGLMALNIAIIESICKATQINTPRDLASEHAAEGGERIERLVDLCQSVGATTYLSPVGAQGYLNGSTAFDQAGITLNYFDFDHPTYPQLHPPFVSHLSALDALAHTGPEGFKALITSGQRASLSVQQLETRLADHVPTVSQSGGDSAKDTSP